MTARERWRASLLFQQPDKIFLHPGSPRESTLKAWHQQGLPQGLDWENYLMEILGIQFDKVGRSRIDLGATLKMIPTFEEKILEHRNGHYLLQDWMGSLVEISDQYDLSYLREAKDFVTRKWHSAPVQNREDWEEKMKWRYDPQHVQRFPEDFAESCQALRQRDDVLQLIIPGPFWQLREWCGFEGLCMLLLDDPDFVQEMIDFWTNFVQQILERILPHVEPDYVQISEDMAYKQHSMVSPKMTRKFLLPTWKAWIKTIEASGAPIVSMDSDGYIAELLPLWIEAGFNCNFPIETAAGNDIVAYRQTYGKQMAYLGGIDKRALAAGGKEMRTEIMRVVPPLFQEGGYIPGCDHGVPPDISWPNFVEYTRLLAELSGWL